MAETEIAWADKVWNPFVGCSRVSQCCKNCYAEKMAWRLAHIPATRELYSKVVRPDGGGWSGGVAFAGEQTLEAPLHWRKPCRVFVNSMGDLFREGITDKQLDVVFAVMALCSQHQFLVLTKRPERMREYVNYSHRASEIRDAMIRITEKYHEWIEYPLPNIWIGVSVEDQATADERIPILLQTPAAVRWVSVEPMLGDVDLEQMSISTISYPYSMQKINWRTNVLTGISAEGKYAPNFKEHLDWVVVGCESGAKRRPCRIEWVESIVSQCQAAGVPVFVKQLDIGGEVVRDISKFPKHLQVREFPQ